MSWDGDLDDLVSGASNPDDDLSAYGLAPGQSARLAKQILAEERAGMTPPAPEPRPNANPHLSGPRYDGYSN
jgi:hypothetical protein